MLRGDKPQFKAIKQWLAKPVPQDLRQYQRVYQAEKVRLLRSLQIEGLRSLQFQPFPRDLLTPCSGKSQTAGHARRSRPLELDLQSEQPLQQGEFPEQLEFRELRQPIKRVVLVNETQRNLLRLQTLVKQRLKTKLERQVGQFEADNERVAEMKAKILLKHKSAERLKMQLREAEQSRRADRQSQTHLRKERLLRRRSEREQELRAKANDSAKKTGAVLTRSKNVCGQTTQVGAIQDLQQGGRDKAQGQAGFCQDGNLAQDRKRQAQSRQTQVKLAQDRQSHGRQEERSIKSSSRKERKNVDQEEGDMFHRNLTRQLLRELKEGWGGRQSQDWVGQVLGRYDLNYSQI